MSRVCLAIVTDGRPGVLERTFASFAEGLVFPMSHTMIVDDSGEKDYYEFLKRRFGNHVDAIHHHEQRWGYSLTMADVWSKIPRNMDWVFHLEDDFTLNRPIELKDWIGVLRIDPRVIQIVALRQPWSYAEQASGGLIQLRRKQGFDYLDKDYPSEYGGLFPVVEHRGNFSFNPTLYSAELTQLGWPQGYPGTRSEYIFGQRLLEKQPNRVFLLWGKSDDPPLVTHFGRSRQ